MTGPDSEGLQDDPAEYFFDDGGYGSDSDMPDPSVRAVPVEVPPQGAILDLAAVLRDAWVKAEPDHSVTKHPTSYVATFVDMARAAYPLIAARVRAEGEKQMAEAERILEQAIRERDEAEEWADRLAAALAGDTAGEHSSANNPWQNALDIAAEREDRVRAEERRRAASELQQFFKDYRGVDWGDVIELSRRIMAGSAVPVATPEHDAGCQRLISSYHEDEDVSRCGAPAVAEVFTTAGLWQLYCAIHSRDFPADRLRALAAAVCPDWCVIAVPHTYEHHDRLGSALVTGPLPVAATPHRAPTCPACGSLDPNRDLVNGARCVHRFHSLANSEQDGQR